MKRARLLIAILFLLPLAHAQKIEAISAPDEVTKGSKLEIYIRFVNDLNETLYVKQLHIEIISSNDQLVNSSDTDFFIALEPNETATLYAYMIISLDPGDYKYNVLVYYKQGDETKSKEVISGHKLLVKTSSNPRLILGLTVLLFGVTLGFLVRLGSRSIGR